MTIKQNLINQFVAGFLAIIFVTCNDQTEKASEKSLGPETVDSLNHGYDELANIDHKSTFTVSDFNTDNQDIKNIERPSISTINSRLDTTLLFGVWTSDLNGPHADFQFTRNYFYVVDYDGDGNMPYEITNNKLKVYYNDFIKKGEIISLAKDTLKIRWADFDNVSDYVRWKQ